MLLVTGATGYLGRLVANSLLRHGHRVRFMIRGADRPAGCEHPRAQVARADFTDPGSLHIALAQIDAAFLVCGGTSDRPRFEMTFIDAAEAQGVRVVKLSALGAAADAPTFLRWHHHAEEHLREHATGSTAVVARKRSGRIRARTMAEELRWNLIRAGAAVASWTAARPVAPPVRGPREPWAAFHRATLAGGRLASPVDESLELLRVALAVHPDLCSGGVDVA